MNDDFIYSFLKKELKTKLINNLTDDFKNENIEGLDNFIINKVHEITNRDIDFNDIKPKKHINENKTLAHCRNVQPTSVRSFLCVCSSVLGPAAWMYSCY